MTEPSIIPVSAAWTPLAAVLLAALAWYAAGLTAGLTDGPCSPLTSEALRPLTPFLPEASAIDHDVLRLQTPPMHVTCMFWLLYGPEAFSSSNRFTIAACCS